MDRRLISYLPPVLRDVLELKTVNDANEPEISAAWDALDRLMANQFLDTADSAGVSIWERELGIRPKGTDTLEVRKLRIKSMWNLELPYAITWLRQWLSAVADGLPFEVGIRDYTLNIFTQWDRAGQVDSIKNVLVRIVPSNMTINFENTITCSTEGTHNVAGAVTLCDCIYLSG